MPGCRQTIVIQKKTEILTRQTGVLTAYGTQLGIRPCFRAPSRFFQGESVKIPVIPAQAGIQKRRGILDSRLRGNDGVGYASDHPIILPNDCVKFKVTAY
jgi:hypothetical protein